ncbi:unnamed protein product [Vitrella brassicaformis CCMP3155]|uniref:Uncharacterized protein n=1 Tax=Vitrella brassicaformis (strain CCMP3155) TaxID=1169540 RepID=A0A0G4G3Y5_VITBC|nr:unnamed protein product [Vitrella brassicaformis CCMP3155]|eukprot:CEM22597.1 unnamed protein product [Vitrella brassicaformis CCMP3155]
MASSSALSGAGLSPTTMAQQAETVNHSKMKELEAFIERCNSQLCGDLMVVRSTILVALEVENLVKSTLNSQLAAHIKSGTKAKHTLKVMRLSPTSSAGGRYYAVTVLRDISVAMWPRTKGGSRTKGGKPVIVRRWLT